MMETGSWSELKGLSTVIDLYKRTSKKLIRPK